MKKIILICSIGLIGLTSCKKESNSAGCWRCTDSIGNYLQTTCGDNEQDAFNKSGTIGGTHDINTFRTYCKKQ